METTWGAVDPNRFPWVHRAVEPTVEETEAAVLATAAMMATRRVVTARANQAKRDQEELVTARLRTEGFEEVKRRRIRTLEDAPQRGTYCGESLLGSRKADVVVRLHDGRVMAIECKVSNSSTNSVKRLNNDAAAKAVSWVAEFGTAATVPTVVLSGVFKTHNLLQAQNQGLTVFWAHDLDSLATFLAHAQ
jgi:XamI restriction endonuclease.